jgi:hypothetical protein
MLNWPRRLPRSASNRFPGGTRRSSMSDAASIITSLARARRWTCCGRPRTECPKKIAAVRLSAKLLITSISTARRYDLSSGTLTRRCSLEHGLAVATRNISDFEPTGVATIELGPRQARKKSGASKKSASGSGGSGSSRRGEGGDPPRGFFTKRPGGRNQGSGSPAQGEAEVRGRTLSSAG